MTGHGHAYLSCENDNVKAAISYEFLTDKFPQISDGCQRNDGTLGGHFSCLDQRNE